mmetsp:Transcript_15557/g.30545  ORF Transcript_15557/g.30545 Transcript_15557/m.30545 type:complete len:145 (-) Transcript_15557:76-510(-)|eukprot:CAMPEP_0175125914 /NCGR_PEP_ID=MMETSP0087-20121206/3564_1 /TAXON_ID=136419 /ORGANISM="Unknown Unknown, Strain D1" /LENGTH=144 /DNA_ID=CAMNT_0016407771 /DNA_START=51 /DNA_END=485 /DNA_ORIENTATION=+
MKLVVAVCTLLGVWGKNYTDPFTSPCDTKGHFGNLTDGSDTTYAICTPECKSDDGTYNNPCPTADSQGWKGGAACIGYAPSRKATFCQILCTPCDDTFCGDGAFCMPIQNVGICQFINPWKNNTPPYTDYVKNFEASGLEIRMP